RKPCRGAGFRTQDRRRHGRGGLVGSRCRRGLSGEEAGMSAALQVSGLSAGYGQASVLDSVSIAAEPGEIIAVVGANGAGKTTLLNTIAGIVAPTAGRIVFDGADIAGVAAHALP